MRKARNGLILSTYSEPPVLLSVNAESREAILEVYKGEIESKGARKIRFDVENDTILLENRCNMGKWRRARNKFVEDMCDFVKLGMVHMQGD